MERFRLPSGLTCVAVDGGTTNTRARLLCGDRVAAEALRAVGARDVAATGSAGPLAAAVREVIAEVCAAGGIEHPDRIVACGMLTSEVGLAAVPHVEAPAGLDDLARAAVVCERPEVARTPILLVPGVRTPPGDGPDGWADADVMRGEECETLGWWYSNPPDGPDRPTARGLDLFLWPGSHTKLVAVDADGRIVASHTTLAGELIATLARHTILAASLPAELPRTLDPEATAAGARLARRDGFGRTAFLVRIAALNRDWTAEQRAAFLVGAVVAEDVDRLCRHPLMAPERRPRVFIGGAGPLCRLYGELLGRLTPGAVIAADVVAASALGAAFVAHRRAAGVGGPDA